MSLKYYRNTLSVSIGKPGFNIGNTNVMKIFETSSTPVELAHLGRFGVPEVPTVRGPRAKGRPQKAYTYRPLHVTCGAYTYSENPDEPQLLGRRTSCRCRHRGR